MKIDEKKLAMVIARSGGLTMEQLAMKSGVSRQTLSLARAGKRIKTDTAAKIAVALGVDIEDISERLTIKSQVKKSKF